MASYKWSEGAVKWLLDKCKTTFATKDLATKSSDGLLSSGDKAKLDGVSAILPSDTAEIQTKYRIAKKSYTGSFDTRWWYKLCKFPINNSNNGSSAIISGRIGGWANDNMSYINAIVWNRNKPGISLIDFAASADNMSAIWNHCDLELYVDSDSTATLYLKCSHYFTYDLNVEGLLLSTGTIKYDGTYITTTPSGTLTAKASTATNKLELCNNSAYIGGNTVVQSLKFQNITVPASAWSSGAGFAGATRTRYADIALAGVTSDMYATVTFNPDDIDNYNMAGICATKDGKITIYAEYAPSVAITIPTIICLKA